MSSRPEDIGRSLGYGDLHHKDKENEKEKPQPPPPKQQKPPTSTTTTDDDDDNNKPKRATVTAQSALAYEWHPKLKAQNRSSFSTAGCCFPEDHGRRGCGDLTFDDYYISGAILGKKSSTHQMATASISSAECSGNPRALHLPFLHRRCHGAMEAERRGISYPPAVYYKEHGAREGLGLGDIK
ncbi:hypothetical protein RIF29_05587 [Crotalaria pallida]|uniref:Uncharacterized protein n=1 Tax=Crotalaria pallida TaxID=3830 RepID=A0AAN9PB10_CROPI